MKLLKKKAFYKVIKNRDSFKNMMFAAIITIIMILDYVVAHLINILTHYKLWNDKWEYNNICDIIGLDFLLAIIIICGLAVLTFVIVCMVNGVLKIRAIFRLSYLPLTAEELDKLNVDTIDDFIMWYEDFLSYKNHLSGNCYIVVPDKETLINMRDICLQRYGKNPYFNNTHLHEYENEVMLLSDFCRYISNYANE